jgi:hypothetical protein
LIKKLRQYYHALWERQDSKNVKNCIREKLTAGKSKKNMIFMLSIQPEKYHYKKGLDL